MPLNSVEINILAHKFATGELTKEVLDHMLQVGHISISEWIEIQSIKITENV